jgi:hypothetical protein
MNPKLSAELSTKAGASSHALLMHILKSGSKRRKVESPMCQMTTGCEFASSSWLWDDFTF